LILASIAVGSEANSQKAPWSIVTRFAYSRLLARWLGLPLAEHSSQANFPMIAPHGAGEGTSTSQTQGAEALKKYQTARDGAADRRAMWD
jgi:hypothetical protein